MLKKYNNELEILAKALLEFETLTGDEIKDILAGKEIRKASSFIPSKPLKTSSVPNTTTHINDNGSHDSKNSAN